MKIETKIHQNSWNTAQYALRDYSNKSQIRKHMYKQTT